MKLMLNGFLLPNFSRWGNHQVLRRNQRGDMRLAWGSAKITYVDEQAKLIMTVQHDKSAILRLGWLSLKNLARLTWNYRAIKARWRSGFDGLTSAAFWEDQFGSDPTGQGGSAEPGPAASTVPSVATSADVYRTPYETQGRSPSVATSEPQGLVVSKAPQIAASAAATKPQTQGMPQGAAQEPLASSAS
jgi:hypothetical protein